MRTTLRPTTPPSPIRFRAPVLLLAVLAGGGVSSVLAQSCPSALLDRDRAYFGSTLSANRCHLTGERCRDVLFVAEQRYGTAVCTDGRWQAEAGSEVAPSCPEYVFADGEVWDDGAYLPNVCDPASAPRCPGTFFFRLPTGGAGHDTATCVDDEWRPQSDADPAPFRLRRVVTAAELEAAVKEGLEATYGGGSPYLYGPWGVEGPSGGGGSGFDGGAIPVSETNVQETGVDEEDRLETDGDHLYVLKNHQTLRAPAPGDATGIAVRILDIDPLLVSATALSELEVDTGDSQAVRGLYLRSEADQLVLVASGYGLDWFSWYSPLAWTEAQSTVMSIDVSDPSRPRQETTLELEGEIVSSRRIDDVLYLALRFQPHLPGLVPFDPGSAAASDQLAKIEQAEWSELLPGYRTNADPESRPLVEPWDCYLPTEDAPLDSGDVIALVAIDLDTLKPTSSKCFLGATETIYVSLDSIYVASTRFDWGLVPGPDGAPFFDWAQPEVETDLHKFALDGGEIRYRASGSVDGHLGWNLARKPFRLSERGEDLRVITYTGELTPDRSPVALTVLRDDGDDELRQLARLPNAQRPEPIGKPGEELYATRFVGDRAYLVTFQITDPLYVVDLSDPEDPFVAGELEITGFSDYLHPFDGGYLLGVGKDAIPDPSGDFRGAWYQGVKVALFDVRDPGNPIETDAVLLGKRGSDTPVLYDHRAFTFLPAEGGSPARVALGVRVHERLAPGSEVPPWTFYDWSYSGLQLFEVDTAAGRLVRQGEMRVEQYPPVPPLGGPIHGDDRSVLAGEAIFYLHGDDVYTARWSDPELWQGPE